MHTYVIGVVALWLHSLTAMGIGAQQNMMNHAINGAHDDVTITATHVTLNDATLEVRYQIENRAMHDVWICDSMDVWNPLGFEALPAKDGRTLVIQRRFNLPTEISREQPIARYVRLRGGKIRTEGMSFHLPVRQRQVLSSLAGRATLERAACLVLIIGYCEGDLPRMTYGAVTATISSREPNAISGNGMAIEDALGGDMFLGILDRNAWTTCETVLVSWPSQAVKSEKTVQLSLDDLIIPFSKEYQKPASIRLSPCKRIEGHFNNGALEFFFPFSLQQGLLNEQERQELRSLKDFVVEEPRTLMGLAYDITAGTEDGFFTDRNMITLTCYRKDKSVVSLNLYDDAFVVTREGQVLRCPGGFPTLRMLTPQTRAFDLRTRCAGNLLNLWQRIILYHIAQRWPRSHAGFWRRYHNDDSVVLAHFSRGDEKAYPPVTKWCDALLEGYHLMSDGNDSPTIRLLMCPSTDKGRCHYAMNPDCHYDSPGDVVLLFETKAGWNQHGGPELFTFDNHDPKGGLVLLNDGTVKFIRTEEELNQLRWK